MRRPTWVGQTLGNRYQIEELLGQGGMSAVYKGHDPNLRRTVAIKLIHQHLADDDEFVRRFEEEAAAVARLRHPNIIQVFDFNHDEDTYYMVLEYVEGITLEARLRQLQQSGRRMPQAEIERILGALCKAVGYAHDQGMIHRDLKPANVMIRPDGEPLLMDFGIAKILEGDSNTATGAVLGTVSYMAPEQIKGERPDHRADLYALGVILYEMITGERPYKGDNSASTMMMHLTEPVPDLRRVVSPTDFSGIDMLAAVVQKAMAKEPNQRFQSAAELASAIRNYSPSDDATIVDNSAATILHNYNDTVVASSAPTIQSTPPAAAESSSSKPPWTLIGIVGAILTVLIFGAVWAFSGDDNDGNDPALPAVAEATATFPPLDPEGDEDGDGLKNGRELEIGTDPTKSDTDDDGIPDTAENSVPCLDALNPDTDGDGISDNEDDDPCGLEATPTPTLSVTITEITLTDNRYNVEFTTEGYTPSPGGHHVHFFFDTVTEENSGIPGDGPWDIHTNPDSFTGWGPIDKPAEATQMCAIVANSDHSTILGTSHCFDLPESTAAAPEMTVQITAIELINERYEVTFATAGYTPSPASQHIHFFFNTVDPEQAGVPGEGPWQIHTSPEPFSALGPNDRPDDAMQLCALVADPDHTVRQATGNCFNLPDMGYNYGG